MHFGQYSATGSFYKISGMIKRWQSPVAEKNDLYSDTIYIDN